jgi:CRISPR type III-A-associated RAMP protein Csm5
MKIIIKTLTPVHIGSGKEISPTEYLVEDGYFYRINLNSLFADPDFQNLSEKFIDSALHTRYLGDLIPKEFLKKHILYSLPITGKAKEYLKTNKTIVKEFIKTAGKVFIPGSSLKGSILSAIFYHILKENFSTNEEFILKNLQFPKKYKYEDFLDFVFSRLAKDSTLKRFTFTRWLDVTDSNTKNPSEVLQISLAKVKGSKSGKELPILYETLKVNVEFTTEIKSQNTIFKEEEILSIVDNFYKKVLAKDKNQIKTNEILIRLGQGVTAYATSCLILAEELRISYPIRPPTTRKRIDEILPMGWVKIQKG